VLNCMKYMGYAAKYTNSRTVSLAC